MLDAAIPIEKNRSPSKVLKSLFLLLNELLSQEIKENLQHHWRR